MSIFTTEETDFSNVGVSSPRTSGNVMYADILNGEDPLYLQIPRTRCTLNGPILSIEMTSDSFYGLLRSLEQKLCEIVARYSKEWFTSPLSVNDVSHKLFRTAIKLPGALHDPLTMSVHAPYSRKQHEFEVYTRPGRVQSPAYLEKRPRSECTVLVLAKDLIFTESSVAVSWELAQVLVHAKKKTVKGFVVRTDTPTKNKSTDKSADNPKKDTQTKAKDNPTKDNPTKEGKIKITLCE